jgi:hypothetical protein
MTQWRRHLRVVVIAGFLGTTALCATVLIAKICVLMHLWKLEVWANPTGMAFNYWPSYSDYQAELREFAVDLKWSHFLQMPSIQQAGPRPGGGVSNFGGLFLPWWSIALGWILAGGIVWRLTRPRKINNRFEVVMSEKRMVSVR